MHRQNIFLTILVNADPSDPSLFSFIFFLFKEASADFFANMTANSGPLRFDEDPLKEIVTLTSNVGSLVLDTRMQSRHKTINRLNKKTLRMSIKKYLY